MDEKAIFKLCKDEGCCDACCLRYLGLKHPRIYENVKESVKKYRDETEEDKPDEQEYKNGTADAEHNGTNGEAEHGEPEAEHAEPAAKRPRGAPCSSCLGLLQPETWEESCQMAKEALDKKGYDCPTFACALSAPLANLLREKYMLLTLKAKFPEYDTGSLTSLKESWKWSFGRALAARVGRALESGAAAPLLLSLHYDHRPDTELELLKQLSPAAAPHKRLTDLTRRGAEQALQRATLEQLGALQPPAEPARCVAVNTARAPLYLGGRYVKLSRRLPQTPWLARGERVMESSVQEVIFKPIAELFGLSPEQAEHRLKLQAAGREDVDVRCLGEGRPFAVEISDPRRELTAAELARACELISSSGTVVVRRMVHVTKEDLLELKKGEETKSKEYEALCIKLEHSAIDKPSDPSAPITVTPEDIERINSYTNTPPGDEARVRLVQKTPIRVLHRRPLLARERAILALRAEAVPGHPQLFVARLRCAAGTYVKEWAHGELARSAPSLGAALGARADILALDVAAVRLPWPPHSAE